MTLNDLAIFLARNPSYRFELYRSSETYCLRITGPQGSYTRIYRDLSTLVENSINDKESLALIGPDA
jgi:hypothetical protein